MGYPADVLSALDLTKTFRTPAGDVHALRGFAHEFTPGRLTAIVGPSGSGKSTLLNLLAALDQPTSGTVGLDGVPFGRLTERERSRLRRDRFGIVFQAFNLIAVLNAQQNVEFPMGLAGVPKAERSRRARALLERLGLGGRARQLPYRLSGGERQRVAIARALANDPAVVFADEPTGNLDSASSRLVMDALREVTLEGRTVIVVTHDAELAAQADEVLTLRDGRLVGNTRPAEATGREASS